MPWERQHFTTDSGIKGEKKKEQNNSVSTKDMKSLIKNFQIRKLPLRHSCGNARSLSLCHSWNSLYYFIHIMCISNHKLYQSLQLPIQPIWVPPCLSSFLTCISLFPQWEPWLQCYPHTWFAQSHNLNKSFRMITSILPWKTNLLKGQDCFQVWFGLVFL